MCILIPIVDHNNTLTLPHSKHSDSFLLTFYTTAYKFQQFSSAIAYLAETFFKT